MHLSRFQTRAKLVCGAAAMGLEKAEATADRVEHNTQKNLLVVDICGDDDCV